MQYMTQNGWTREKMKEQIRKYNNGTKAIVGNACQYLTADNNRCAAGCFFPDDHRALSYYGNIVDILHSCPDLEEHFPLGWHGMHILQQKHDNYSGTDLRPALFQWIDENVIEPGEESE